MALLETIQHRSARPELVESQTRHKIREIVRAYRHSWDIYSELLQNSVDAINRRFRILNDPDFHLFAKYRQQFPELELAPSYIGAIKITVNVPERIIEIRDNGVGIEAARIEEFLLPEGSDKRVGQEYGFKGYGLTYAAFISREFYIASHPFLPASSDASEFSLNGLFEWLIDETGSIPFPNLPAPNTRPMAEPIDGEWSTVIRVKLAEDYAVSFPAVSSAEQAIQLIGSKERLEGFEYILRSRTAIGNTRPLFNKAPIVPIDVRLNIVFADGEPINDLQIPYQYYHPKEHNELKDFSYNFRDYYERYKNPAFRETSFRCLYHPATDVTVGSRTPLQCDFALSSIALTRLTHIEEDLGFDDIEGGDVGVSNGVYLSINGMPTGLRIDDWNTRGAYLKRFFVVVDADMQVSTQLDPGRKGISQYYARMISDKALNLINTSRVDDSAPFASYASKHLDWGRGTEEGGLPPQDFQVKIQQVNEQGRTHEEQQADLLHKLRQVSSLNYLPTDEQEVIALFYELLTQNIIKGYRTIYLGASRTVYDAALEYEISSIPENIHPNDPLGLGQVLVGDLENRGQSTYSHREHYAGRTARPELCIDFKRTVGHFLDEVIVRSGRTSKDPRIMDMLIVWDIDVPTSVPETAYTIDPLSNNRRIFHSTTHRLGLIREYAKEILCISLKEVLSRLTLTSTTQGASGINVP